MSTQGLNNSLIPGEPEFGKSWKAENNFGCCPNCRDIEPPECTTIISAFTRTNRNDSLITRITDRYCRCQDKSTVVGCTPDLVNNTCSD